MSGASNSNGNGAGGDGEHPAASYTFIDTLGEGLAEAVMAMNAASLVAVDCEGVELSRAGELCLLQLGTGEFWRTTPPLPCWKQSRSHGKTVSTTRIRDPKRHRAPWSHPRLAAFAVGPLADRSRAHHRVTLRDRAIATIEQSHRASPIAG